MTTLPANIQNLQLGLAEAGLELPLEANLNQLPEIALPLDPEAGG